MKKLTLMLLILIGTGHPLSAATRTDVNILEATESIRFLSQEITKNYLYLFANPGKDVIKKQIHAGLNELVQSIRTISISTDDEDTQAILEFLIYSKDQIEELIQGKPDKEKAALMLDYSETLLEGANSIAKTYSYNFSESEKMLMIGKRIEYLLERSSKYYMALGIGLGTEINRKQMNNALGKLEKNLQTIEHYNYPSRMQKDRILLRKSWEVTKSFFDRRKEMFVSNLEVLSSREMESITRKFILYHRKAQ